MIKLFEEYIINETISRGFYEYDNEIVYVYDIEYLGGEYRVHYKKEDGTKLPYTATNKEIEEDFEETDKKFEFNLKTKTPKEDFKKDNKKDIKYNIVFYLGKTKVETIQYNVEKNLAYRLKNHFSKNPKYKGGRIKLEIN